MSIYPIWSRYSPDPKGLRKIGITKGKLTISEMLELVQDIASALQFLAFVSIGLMSVTIPTYAISISYLGRGEGKRP